MDFVFHRTADRRVLKTLTIVDDATHEVVAIVPELAIGGLWLTRILDQLALQRGLPSTIRTVNGKEFCGRAHAVMGSSTWHFPVFNRTWKTMSKRLYRIVQWALSR